ncbi:hypothetical protein CQA66_03420 [Helicobacter aurati]|uniref:Uncharacterized protein n=1 Tax=Helicobacter aurati TaxID=137778 RepID=A0A3D8J6N3_9HELI|nr:hypothetical protein [Helicobacter aurati]RDU72940.1 hypothetical protein CQA66_03420 [Helicobacter aurati]
MRVLNFVMCVGLLPHAIVLANQNHTNHSTKDNNQEKAQSALPNTHKKVQIRGNTLVITDSSCQADEKHSTFSSVKISKPAAQHECE